MKVKTRVLFPYLRLLQFSIICGLCISANHANAATVTSVSPSTITVDTKNASGLVNYDEVNKFISEQGKNIKFAETDAESGNLILATDPIEHIYQAKNFSDLRLTLNTGHKALITPVSKLSSVKVANKDLVKMPDVSVIDFANVQTKPTITVAQTSSKFQAADYSAQVSSIATPVNVILGLTALVLISLLLVMRSRKVNFDIKTSFHGRIPDNATDMIGKGEMFDFNKNAFEVKLSTIDSNYLNLLWQMRRFSISDESVTYFYAGFFIPPQNNYATNLQQKLIAKKVIQKENA